MKDRSQSRQGVYRLPPRALLYLFLACLSTTLWVCSSTSHVQSSTDNFEAYHELPITAVVMKDGSRVAFDKDGGRYTEEWNTDKVSRRVIGRDFEGRSLNVNLAKALEVEALYKTTNVGGTILTVLAVAVLTFVGSLIVYLALNPIRS